MSIWMAPAAAQLTEASGARAFGHMVMKGRCDPYSGKYRVEIVWPIGGGITDGRWVQAWPRRPASMLLVLSRSIIMPYPLSRLARINIIVEMTSRAMSRRDPASLWSPLVACSATETRVPVLRTACLSQNTRSTCDFDTREGDEKSHRRTRSRRARILHADGNMTRRRSWRMTMTRRTQRDHDKDPAGERGGDTGPSSYVGDGPQAEKGDQRRDKPVHSGPTRNGKQDKRSGSDSNDSR